MPPKSKRYRQLCEAANNARTLAKKPRPESASESVATSGEASVSAIASPIIRPSVDSEIRSMTSDTSYDPEVDIASNDTLRMEKFAEEWLLSLDREDRISLGLFLSHHLKQLFNFTLMNSIGYAAFMTDRSERALAQWRREFLANGEVPDSKQGKYQRSGVLWSSEELNKKAKKYMQANASVKGQPNITAAMFCQWVNDDLLPNSSLAPGFPRKISTETARKWLHHLGFEVLTPSKGMFFDGHEREDVVEYRGKFLKQMIETGFLHPSDAPTPESQAAFPHDVPLASIETREKTVFFFHDESAFHANEDQKVQWGEKGTHMIRPKSQGSGMMVSDFVDEKNGYLALSDDEYAKAKSDYPNLQQHARAVLEYGESRDGYWTSAKFIAQMEKAVEIAEVKYPKSEQWKHVWIFDSSSCHLAMAEDSLDAKSMNVKPGEKQKVMRDTVWNGRLQKLNFALGVPKGLKIVLKERGINTRGLNREKMIKILEQHYDFKEEKCKLEHFMESRGHRVIFLPKYHPELNPIERVWAQSKRYTKAYCKYNLPSLRNTIPLGLDSVTVKNIQNYHRKVRHYMCAYLQGFVAGGKLEETVKKYKKAAQAHRKISVNE